MIDDAPASLRAAAARLVRHMDAAGADGTPLELRLRLGLVRLGVAPESIGDMQLMGLSKQLARRLPRALALATRRLLLARGPIPRGVLPRLTGAQGAELDLLVTCIAYGDATVQVPDQTRAILLEQLRYLGVRAPATELEEGHQILAAHCQSLDGQRQERALAQLAQEIEDADEARRLGDSVYPPEVPMTERWRAPRVLAERTVGGVQLEAWWAGRVVDADADRVLVVLAQGDEAQQVSFTSEEWLALAGEAAHDARGYLELGRYSDGARIVRRVPSAPAPAESDEIDYVMGRLSRWPD